MIFSPFIDKDNTTSKPRRPSAFPPSEETKNGRTIAYNRTQNIRFVGLVDPSIEIASSHHSNSITIPQVWFYPIRFLSSWQPTLPVYQIYQNY